MFKINCSTLKSQILTIPTIPTSPFQTIPHRCWILMYIPHLFMYPYCLKWFRTAVESKNSQRYFVISFLKLTKCNFFNTARIVGQLFLPKKMFFFIIIKFATTQRKWQNRINQIKINIIYMHSVYFYIFYINGRKCQNPCNYVAEK